MTRDYDAMRAVLATAARGEFDYQSDWHCSKTQWRCPSLRTPFDYQSDWHCSKTLVQMLYLEMGYLSIKESRTLTYRP